VKATQLAVSPCSNPDLALDEALEAYARIGFAKFEAFTSWVASALDWRAPSAPYTAAARRAGVRFCSLHLPPVQADAVPTTLTAAVQAAHVAAAVGARVVLFKASDRPTYIEAAPAFLHAVDELAVTPVLQNHAGAPISTLADFREVLDGIGDGRMRTLLEVGHFHAVGVSWREAADALGDSVALVHVKDQIGRQSVPFGTGEIDLPGLVAYLDETGYTGDIVVEMEVSDKENTLTYLAAARRYLLRYCEEHHDS